MSGRERRGDRGRDEAARARVVTALVVIAAANAWYGLAGASVLKAAPVVAAAFFLSGAWIPLRAAGPLLVLWPPVALLLAGVPAGFLLPTHWPGVVVALAGGTHRLTTLWSTPPYGDPWPVAAALVLTGLAYLIGAAVVASPARPGWLPTVGVAILAAPWMWAAALRPRDVAAWEGAALLLAILAWCAPRHAGLRHVLALGGAVALLAVTTTYAVGPREKWYGANSARVEPAFATLDTTQTYGPLTGRRDGAAMLDVTASRPALWRMQVLERFDWRGWTVAGERLPVLPQPSATPADIVVRVRGLRNDLAVSPGRIHTLVAASPGTADSGEARRLQFVPSHGYQYGVRAETVLVSVEQLRTAPPPSDPRLVGYVRLGPGNGELVAPPLFGQPPDARSTAQLDPTPYAPVARLAREVTAGARTTWDAVASVYGYLRDGNRFRYTIDVPPAGTTPLVDFLLRDRAGYCEHFAGAAALLLRLAGVPARVAVGFATGRREGEGRYRVRDSDAHAWIEVYFQGIGWVPFDPTPASAAQVPPELDLFRPDTGAGHEYRSGGLLAALIAVVAGAVAVLRHPVFRRRTEPAEWLAWLARRTGTPVTPATTLAELRTALAVLGPHTAALADRVQQARFAAGDGIAVTRRALTRALVADVGLARTVLLAVPQARRR